MPRQVIRTIGDMELWVVNSKGVKPWSLPFYASPCENEQGRQFYVCKPCSALPQSQYEALLDAIYPHSCIPDKDRWLLAEETLPMIAAKAPGVTPSFYTSWPQEVGERKMQKKIDEQFDSKGSVEGLDDPCHEDGFLRQVFKKCNIVSMPQLRVLWEVIQEEAGKRVYQNRKGLDFGFCKIVALPYRSNWKQIVLRDFPSIRRWWDLSRPKKTAMIESSELPERIRRSDMLAVDNSDYSFKWSLDVVPSGEWEEWIGLCERARLVHLSRERYAIWWMKQITALEGLIYEILGHFYKSTSIPCGGVRKGIRGGGGFITPYIPVKRTTGPSVDVGKVDVVSFDPSVVVENYGEPGPVEGEAGVMS